jgi:lambda family phage tail tape measure protein
MAKQMYEQLGTLAKGWADLKAGVKSYWDELMRMGGAEDKQSKEFQSATTLVIRAIENKEKALALAEKTGRTISEQEMARYDYFINKYRKIRDAIVDARRATTVKTESENAAKREEESLKSAIARVEATGKLSSAREKLARIDKDIALIKGAKEGDVLDRETKLADLHRQRIDVLESLKDKNKSAGVDALASLDAQKKALEANLAGLKAQSFEYEKATEAQKELWKIEYKRDNRIKDDTSPQRIAYLNAIIKLEKQVKEEQEKAKANEDWSKDNSKLRDYIKALDEQNIAIRDGGLEKAKMSATDLKLAEAQSALTKGVDDHTRATLEERIALLLTAKEKERANTGAAAAQKIGRETVEYQEAATATLENYIAAQKEESKQIGMSTAQRKMRSEWLALESKKNLELAAVDARLSKERTTLTKEEVAGLEERRRVIMANYDAQQRAVNEQPLFKQLEGSSFSADASASYQDFYNGLTTRQQEFQSFYSSSYSLMTDAMANFFQTGKFNAKEFAVSMLKTITQVIAKLLILKAIEMATNSFGGGSAAAGSAGNSLANSSSSVLMNANGNAFGNNGVARFAKGGAFTNSIVSRPTSFAFASGGTFHNGLMGEAGPEAVMPLTRTSSGKLGVEAVGGSGGDNITINVSVASDGSSSTTTSGTSVEDQKMIGKALAAKIKDVIIQERRPGGVLA